jgi:rod shape determining protein RodA
MNSLQDNRTLLRIDWLTILIFAAMVIFGWFNIFAAVYDAQASQSIFDGSLNSGKQLRWIGGSLILIIVIMVIDYKFYDSFAYIIYALVLLLVIATFGVGAEIAGSRSWIRFGAFQIQPAEFAKMATALALARFLSAPGTKLTDLKTLMIAGMIIAIPPILTILQNETGSALVFAIFIIVLYREGLPPFIPVLGLLVITVFVLTLVVPQEYLLPAMAIIALFTALFVLPRNLKNIGLTIAVLTIVVGISFGVNYFVNNILQPHQQNRIKALINPDADPLGFGWNVTQSKIAIGSGGFFGKGFLEGTQTKFNFVPEQSTDFIFCTIGEEHGWMGSLILIGLFVGLLSRLVFLAERQKSKFARVYGYGVASIIFFHFTINVGMTVGLFPVIGIPLPFFSYGGSSLWSFTILLFIFLKLDAHRSQMLDRSN